MARIRDTFVNASTGFWVIDDKSGQKITASSFRNLKFTLISHRKANNLPWSQSEIEDMIHCQVCARETAHYCRDANSAVNKSKAQIDDEWGVRMWKSLHKAAVDGILNAEWLKDWEKGLPPGTCSCKNHWKVAKKEAPFNGSFDWTWRAHNIVNRILGKPQVSLEKALEIWSNI